MLGRLTRLICFDRHNRFNHHDFRVMAVATSAIWTFDRHRGGGHPPTPATPPCVRVRTRRFELVTLATRGSVRGRFPFFVWRRGRSGGCGPGLWAKREEEIGAGTHLLRLS